MRTLKIAGAATIVAMLVTVASALQKQAPAHPNGAAPTGPAPSLEIDSLTHDFGEVNAGEPLRFAFIVKNKGTADLQITGVSPG